jgi:Icc-related predicted phosphoesterase
MADELSLMRLHILSDLHLEFQAFTPPAVEADAVILAGDVGTGRSGLEWALKTLPDRPVIYVVGNHEFYGHTLEQLMEELREMAAGTHIHLLENESFRIGDIIFLGAALWTDFALNGDLVLAEILAQTGMNDYKRIRTSPDHRALRPSDTRRFHLESRRWLENQLFGLKGRKVVVVTHHAPSPQSIPSAFEGNAFNPAFASDMSPLIAETEARLWVHGHIHRRSDYRIGKTRVLANPRGYPTESREGFDPGLIVEI